MRTMNLPPVRLAYSQLKRAVRAFPTCKRPVGEGAKRTRTVPLSISHDHNLLTHGKSVIIKTRAPAPLRKMLPPATLQGATTRSVDQHDSRLPSPCFYDSSNSGHGNSSDASRNRCVWSSSE